MTYQFRVLIVDDDLEVISRLQERLVLDPISFEGRNWEVDLRIVHVKVQTVDEHFSQISSDTFEQLAAACSQPAHLILADYGYATKEVMDALTLLPDQGKEITSDDIVGKILTTVDLVSSAQKYCLDLKVDSYKRESIKKNFIGSTAKLYLYSYTSKAFYKALGEVEARVRRVKASLPGCKVVPVDTKYEFYNGQEFDWPNPSKHEQKFYAHLVGGLINNLIKIEFLTHLLNDSKRLKYVRIRRSSISVAIIVALGGAIGATAEWLGGRILDLFSKDLVVPAYTIIALTMIFILMIGLIVPFAFERVMTGLISKEGSDDHA